MAKVNIEDKRDELSRKFQEAYQQWLAPAEHPHVRWQDVVDARQDVIDHVNALARNEQLTPAQAGKGQ